MEFEISFNESLRQLADTQTRLNTMGKVLDANTGKAEKMSSSMAKGAASLRSQFDNLQRSLDATGKMTTEVSTQLEAARATATKTFQAMADGNTKATVKLSALNGELGNLERLVKDTAAKQAYIKWQEKSAALSADMAGQASYLRDRLKALNSEEGKQLNVLQAKVKATEKANRADAERRTKVEELKRELAGLDSIAGRQIVKLQQEMQARKQAINFTAEQATKIARLKAEKEFLESAEGKELATLRASLRAKEAEITINEKQAAKTAELRQQLQFLNTQKGQEQVRLREAVKAKEQEISASERSAAKNAQLRREVDLLNSAIGKETLHLQQIIKSKQQEISFTERQSLKTEELRREKEFLESAAGKEQATLRATLRAKENEITINEKQVTKTAELRQQLEFLNTQKGQEQVRLRETVKAKEQEISASERAAAKNSQLRREVDLLNSAIGKENLELQAIIKAKQQEISFTERQALKTAELRREKEFLDSAAGKEQITLQQEVRSRRQAATATKDQTQAVSSLIAIQTRYSMIIDQQSNAQREMSVTGQKLAWGYDLLTTRLADYTAQQNRAKAAIDAANKAMIEGANNIDKYTGANGRAVAASKKLAEEETRALNKRKAQLDQLRAAIEKRDAQDKQYAATARANAEATRKMGEAEARNRTEREKTLRGAKAYNDAMQREAQSTLTAADAAGVYAAQLARLSQSAMSGGTQHLNNGLTQMSARGREATASLRALTAQEAQLQAKEERLVSLVEMRNRLTMEKARATNTASNAQAKQVRQTERQVEEYKRLAKYTNMTNAQLLGFSKGTSRLSRDMHINAQAAAMFRAALGGLNASIGIYTSATVLAASATYAMASAIRTGLEAGMEFTETMARAEAIMMTGSDAYTQAGKSMEAVEMQVRALGASTIFTATEVAGGLVDLGMAGLSAADAIIALEPALSLASIGAIEMSQSADIATNVMTAFDKTASDLGEVVDIMATAITNSNTSVEQLANALSYVGPAANAAGFELRDTVAAIELLSNAGIKASRAGTGLRRFMLNIQNPTAKGAKVIDEFGISIVDAEGQTRSMIDILGQFNTALHDDAITPAERTAAIMDLVGVRAQSAVARMIGSFDEFSVLRRQLEEVEGAAAQMRKTMEETLSADWKQLKSAFQDIQLDMFQTFEHDIRRVTAGTRLWFMQLKEVNDEMTKEVYTPEQIDMGEVVTEMDILIAKISEAAEISVNLGKVFLAWKIGSGVTTALAAMNVKAREANARYSTLNERTKALSLQQRTLNATTLSTAGALSVYQRGAQAAWAGTAGLTTAVTGLTAGLTYLTRAMSFIAPVLAWGSAIYFAYQGVKDLFGNDTQSRIENHNDRVEESKRRYKELESAINATAEAEQRRALLKRVEEADTELEAVRGDIPNIKVALELVTEPDAKQRMEDQLFRLNQRAEELEKQSNAASEAMGQIGFNQAQVGQMSKQIDTVGSLIGKTAGEVAILESQLHQAQQNMGTGFQSTIAEVQRRLDLKRGALETLVSTYGMLTVSVDEAADGMVNFGKMARNALEDFRATYNAQKDFEAANTAERINILMQRRLEIQQQLDQMSSAGIDEGDANRAKALTEELVENEQDLIDARRQGEENSRRAMEASRQYNEVRRQESANISDLTSEIERLEREKQNLYSQGQASEVTDFERIAEITQEQTSLTNELQRVKSEQAREAEQQSREAQRNAKQQAREIESLLSTYQSLREQFDPLGSALTEYRNKEQDLGRLLEANKISTEEYAAAMAQLKENFSDELEFGIPSEVGDSIQAIREQLDPTLVAYQEYAEKVESLKQGFAGLILEEEEYRELMQGLSEDLLHAVNGTEKYEEMLQRLAETYDSQAMKLDSLKQDEKDILKLRNEANDPETLEKYNRMLENVREEMDNLNLSAEGFGERMENALRILVETLDNEDLSFEDKMSKGAQATDVLAEGIKEMGGEGTRAFKAMTIATDLQTLASAVGAIVNQGFGDPYTAFGRMAAMAAAIQSLGVSVGSFSGGGMTSEEYSEKARENQTAGSVLGDAKSASDSIVNATEITAEATEELVGINRSMLDALNRVQAGIDGATNLVYRDSTVPGMGGQGIYADLGDKISNEIGNIPLVGDIFSSVFDTAMDGLSFLTFGISDLITGMLGGKSKHLDEGIGLSGGNIQDVINDPSAYGYVEWKEKSWVGGSYSYKRREQELDDAVSRQFGLVFESIYDSVYAGVEGLGYSGDQISSRLDSYNLPTTEFSTDGLSPDEQREHIRDVFSRTFDQMAEAAVPFLADMQRAGEGMGETLARVATNLQVGDEAIKRLGISFTELTDATQDESIKFAAQSYERLIEASGGMEEFLTNMSSFVENFNSEADQLGIMYDDLNGAMSNQGFELPKLREGYKELMEAQDASTESGAQNIATLLRLTDTADEYYSKLESLEDAYRSAFYSEQEQTAYNLQQLTEDFHDLGLAVPSSKEAFRALIEAQDRSTDAGEKLYMQLMSLAPAFDELSGSLSGVNLDGYMADLQDAVSARKEQLNEELQMTRELHNAMIDGLNDQRDAARTRFTDLISHEREAYASTRELIQGRLDAENEAHKERMGLLNEEVSTLSDSIGNLESIIGSLEGALSSMGYSNPEQEELARSQALRQLGALRGTEYESGELDKLLSVLTEDSRHLYSSFDDWDREQGRIAATMEDLRSEAGEQLTTEEKSLAELQLLIENQELQHEERVRRYKDQLDMMKENHDDMIERLEKERDLTISNLESEIEMHRTSIEVAESLHEQEMARLDTQLEYWREQIQIASGTYTATLSVVQAVANLQGAISGSSSFNGMASASIPGFASGGFHMGGARIVGEDGPELEVTGPSRIHSNTHSRKIFDTQPMVDEISALRKQVARLESLNYENTKASKKMTKFMDRWDRTGLTTRQEEVAQ